MNASVRFARLLVGALGAGVAALSFSVGVASADAPSVDVSGTTSTTSAVTGSSAPTAPAKAAGPAKVGKWVPAGPGQLDPDWNLDLGAAIPAGEPATAVP